MDILGANFLQAISLYAPKSSLRCHANVAIIQEPEIDTHGCDIWREADQDEGPGLSQSSVPPATEQQILLNRLRFISDLIITSDEPCDVEFAHEFLERVVARLRELYADPAAFTAEADRSMFFRSAAGGLQEISRRNRMRRDLESAMLECEAPPEESQALVLSGEHSSSWSKICANALPFPSRELRLHAFKARVGLQTCKQYLPQGGITIMQKWRRDAEGIINPMLFDVQEPSRIMVIEQQRADPPSMYNVQRDVSGHRKDSLGMALRPGTDSLHDSFTDSGCDAINVIGGIVCRLNKEAHHVHVSPQQVLGLAWKRFFFVDRMHTEDKVTWHAWNL
ncbi:hypothetical protein LTR53_006271 [Teratosphaeriaceae sp. CCFEE 6253]|nr:hypothetical protein LTR53_006271 [Teratosphaeriaceae sp. CCFEE 6253]